MGRRRTSGDPRRVTAALRQYANLREWLEPLGLRLFVKNDSHHWIVTNESGNYRVEWWPSTAKALVTTRRDQVRSLIETVEEYQETIDFHYVFARAHDELIEVCKPMPSRSGMVVPHYPPPPDIESHSPVVTHVDSSYGATPGYLARLYAEANDAGVFATRKPSVGVELRVALIPDEWRWLPLLSRHEMHWLLVKVSWSRVSPSNEADSETDNTVASHR